MVHSLRKKSLAHSADEDPCLPVSGLRIKKANLILFWQIAQETASGMYWKCPDCLKIPAGGNRWQFPLSQETKTINFQWIVAFRHNYLFNELSFEQCIMQIHDTIYLVRPN